MTTTTTITTTAGNTYTITHDPADQRDTDTVRPGEVVLHVDGPNGSGPVGVLSDGDTDYDIDLDDDRDDVLAACVEFAEQFAPAAA